MKRSIILMAVGLAACGSQEPRGPTVGEIERNCGASGGRPFAETWACVKAGMGSFDGYPDIKAVFLATGDYVAEQIATGKMTDAEAKLAMAKARQQAYEATEARNQRSAADSPPPMMLPPMSRPVFGAGPPQPTIIGTPRGGIICQRTGPDSVICS